MLTKLGKIGTALIILPILAVCTQSSVILHVYSSSVCCKTFINIHMHASYSVFDIFQVLQFFSRRGPSYSTVPKSLSALTLLKIDLMLELLNQRSEITCTLNNHVVFYQTVN